LPLTPPSDTPFFAHFVSPLLSATRRQLASPRKRGMKGRLPQPASKFTPDCDRLRAAFPNTTPSLRCSSRASPLRPITTPTTTPAPANRRRRDRFPNNHDPTTSQPSLFFFIFFLSLLVYLDTKRPRRLHAATRARLPGPAPGPSAAGFSGTAQA